MAGRFFLQGNFITCLKFNLICNLLESNKRQKLNDSSSKCYVNGASAAGNAKDAKEIGEKKKDKKKSKKSKDTAADITGVSNIKKPLSAYMLFNNTRRPTLQAEYPSK
jgi:hypothetical protein